MSNSEVERIHASQVKQLKTKLMNVPLTDIAIKQECDSKNIPLNGILMQNSEIPVEDGYFIMNTDLIGNQGIHWISCIKQGKTIYIYDSFGRANTKILPIFTQKAKQQGYRIKNAGINDQDQYGDKSVDCGHRCISALLIAKKYGINNFMKL